MKKLAILLSGLMHTYTETAPKMLELAEYFNADIFVYTFPNDFLFEGKQSLLNDFKEQYNIDNYRRHKDIKFIEKDEAINILNRMIPETYGNYLKKMSINDFINYTLEDLNPILEEYMINTGSTLSFKRQCGQWNSLKACFDMMSEYENDIGQQYDFIIRCRPDILFNKIEENISDIIELCDENTLYDQNTMYCNGFSKKLIAQFVEEEFLIGSRYVFEILTNFCYPYINVIEEPLIQTNETMFIIDIGTKLELKCQNCKHITYIDYNNRDIKCSECEEKIFKYDLTLCSNNQLRAFLKHNGIICMSLPYRDMCIMKYFKIEDFDRTEPFKKSECHK